MCCGEKCLFKGLKRSKGEVLKSLFLSFFFKLGKPKFCAVEKNVYLNGLKRSKGEVFKSLFF